MDRVDIWSKGEVLSFLKVLLKEGQIKPCENLRIIRGAWSEFYPQCVENLASRKPANNVYTISTGYGAPSSYHWPVCPEDCPRFQKTENFTESLISEEMTEQEEIKSEITPFIAMSFNDLDKEINQYITGILEALEIKYLTGERYSKNSVPRKVKSRILESDLFIDIFVKRDKIKDGGYTTPSWLIKELGIAQGAKKDVIALVERGIKDMADLDYEKEVIYFERNNINSIMKATIKFLEALKEHKLI